VGLSKAYDILRWTLIAKILEELRLPKDIVNCTIALLVFKPMFFERVLKELKSHSKKLTHKFKGIQATNQQPWNLGKMKLFDIIYQDVDKDVSTPHFAKTGLGFLI
jgi:hypothetical protein